MARPLSAASLIEFFKANKDMRRYDRVRPLVAATGRRGQQQQQRQQFHVGVVAAARTNSDVNGGGGGGSCCFPYNRYLTSSISAPKTIASWSPPLSCLRRPLHTSLTLDGVLRRRTSLPSKLFSTWPLDVSKREMADLEERVFRRVGSSVMDPVLGRTVASLNWLHRGIAVSDDKKAVRMLLKLPSLLHPSLSELKDQVRSQAESEIRQWLRERDDNGDGEGDAAATAADVVVTVEAIATKPVPMMARFVEEPEELLEGVGPGLANVSHFLAVYSCKVRTLSA